MPETNQVKQSDHARVVTRPPVIYALGIGIAVGLQYVLPLSLGLELAGDITGGLLLGSGLLLLLLSVLPFLRGQQNPDPLEPTPDIYETGLYAFSRNPMYVGFTLIMTAFGFLFDNVWIFLLLLPVLVVMHYGVILREEAYLEEKFGERYRAYKSRVRRWL